MSRRPGKRRLQDRLNACSAKLQEYRVGMTDEAAEAILALLRRAGWEIDEDRSGADRVLAEAEGMLAAWRPEGAA